MNDIELIQNKIYEIRGQRVMLDRDLAELYGVETRVLNQSVKRNLKRFEGDDFMFRLTKDEANTILSRSQIVTLNKRRGYNIKYLPYAFTELGVAMLSSVLKSEIAINVNREIMRAFVTLRHIITLPDDSNRILVIEQELKKLKDEMNDILRDQNDINEETRMQLDAISIALAELQAKPKEEKPHRRIGFVQDDK
ncbi:MAG: ORF6N domain-containing protein [Bacteroidaceae bacterium]|nr:ORF6N domain-containing protein [Bacteroidaceae bacterium]